MAAGEFLPAVRRISATDAARNFSDLIDRVAYAGEPFVIERGGKAMWGRRSTETRRLTGADFLAWLSTLARPSEEFLVAVEEIARRQDAVRPSAWEESVDSSVLVAAERRQLDLRAALEDHRDETFAISAVTASELLHGVRRVAASRRASTEAFVEALLRRLPVLPFDLVAARVHARLWALLVSKGTPVGERDLLIAAAALANGYVLVTRDKRSVPRIPDRVVDLW